MERVPRETIGEGDVEGAAGGAGNSWAADSLERLLMKPVPGCEGSGHLSSFHPPGERERAGTGDALPRLRLCALSLPYLQ